MIKALAMDRKAATETSILAIEEKGKLLEARKKLFADGTCAEDELDQMLPLPSDND